MCPHISRLPGFSRGKAGKFTRAVGAARHGGDDGLFNCARHLEQLDSTLYLHGWVNLREGKVHNGSSAVASHVGVTDHGVLMYRRFEAW